MELSVLGIMADIMWHEIKNHSNNVELDAFVVMPNHVHGILILTGGSVETGHALSLPSLSSQKQPPAIGQKRFQNIGKNSISSIIGSYKSAITKHAHRLGFDFQWQSRFHDHIIRDDRSFQNIRNYIIENPLNSGERIPRWLCHGVSEQNNKKVLIGIGFLVSSAARSFNWQNDELK